MMRSQIAELFYNSLTHSCDSMSAGAAATLDTTMSKRGIEVMKDTGINTANQFSKQLTPEMIDSVDKVILFPTDYMPDYALHSEKSEMWDVADPHYNKEKGMPFVLAVRDDIKSRIEKLIENQR